MNKYFEKDLTLEVPDPAEQESEPVVERIPEDLEELFKFVSEVIRDICNGSSDLVPWGIQAPKSGFPCMACFQRFRDTREEKELKMFIELLSQDFNARVSEVIAEKVAECCPNLD